MPHPKDKKLKASHGKLRDLVSRYVPSWLPDGTLELLDDVVSEVSECIQCCDHLVVVEGFRRSLAEEKDSLEHVHSGLMDSCLKESRFPLRVTCVFSRGGIDKNLRKNISSNTNLKHGSCRYVHAE